MTELQTTTFGSFNNSAVVKEFKRKQKRLTLVGKVALALVAMVVISPVIYYALSGLIGLGLSLLVGMVIIHAAPVVSMKLANYKLRALKAEAEANPIDTLENQQIAKEAQLKNQESAITKFDSAVETYRGSLMEEARNFPEAAAAGIPRLRDMERLLAYRRIKYKHAQSQLKARAQKVRAAASSYRVALAGQEVTRAAGETDGVVLDKILEGIAFAAVDNAVNTTMAELRTAIMVEEVPVDDASLLIIDREAPAMLEAPRLNINDLMAQLQPRESQPLTIERSF